MNRLGINKDLSENARAADTNFRTDNSLTIAFPAQSERVKSSVRTVYYELFSGKEMFFFHVNKYFSS